MKKVPYNPFSDGVYLKALPTTEGQREIWSSLVLNENSTLCYNESLQVDIKGDLDFEILNRSFQEMIKRHDALRMVFSRNGKTFFIKEHQPNEIEYVDLINKTVDEFEKISDLEVQTKFDLINGPCIRSKVVRRGHFHFSLIVTAHHLVCDGWSFSVFLSELSDIYSQLKNYGTFSLPTPYQFSDYAFEENDQGKNKVDQNYWNDVFTPSLEVLTIPTDFSRPLFRTFDSARVDYSVPSELVRIIKRTSAKNGCSLYTALISTFTIFLNTLTHSNDLVIGIASAGQPATGHKNLIGHLVNLLPFRTTIDKNFNFIEHMNFIRNLMLEAYDHRSYTYGSLVKDLKNIKRSSNSSPLMSIVFNIDQQEIDQGLRFQDLEASFITIPRKFECFELFINAVSKADTLVLECQYNKNIFSEETVVRWLNSYLELVEIFTKDQSKKIKEINFSPRFPCLSAKQIIDDHHPKSIKSNHPILEKRLTKLWGQVLQTSSLQRDDNFFGSGGHSLLAVELANLIQIEFGISFSVKDIFENPTVLEQASIVESKKQSDKKNLPQIVASHQVKALVSDNQLQILIFEEMHLDSYAFILPSTIRVKKKIDLSILEKTIHALIARHPSLRTVFRKENGQYVQEILDGNLPQLQPSIELVATSEHKIFDDINSRLRIPFKKDQAPLFRVVLFQIKEDDYVIFSMIHHLIWDGGSFDIYFKEIDSIYSHFKNNEVLPLLPNPTVNYLDFSIWLDKLLQSPALQSQLDFWKNNLKQPLPILDLPADFVRPRVMGHKGGSYRFQFSFDQSKKIAEFSKRSQSSQFNVFLTAFKITLSRLSGIDDIIVGLPVNGRTSPELKNTIGFFVNTLPLRSQIDLSLSFQENLLIVGKNCSDALGNQLIPFQLILKSLGLNIDLSRSPLFQTFFSYQDIRHRSQTFDGVTYSHLPVTKGTVHTDLDLWIRAGDGSIQGGFDYNLEIFQEITIKRFAECFFQVLEDALSDSTRSLSLFKNLPIDHEKLILNSWNSTFHPYDEFNSIYSQFRSCVKVDPQHVAIETEDEKVTYLYLSQMCNRIASALTFEGVIHGDLVGVAVSRSPKMVAAILAVLKIGAGYVPLDPKFPKERTDYMAENAQVKFRIDDAYIDEVLLVDRQVDDLASSAVTENDTMYVIYTSGSTGKPKGVQVSHGSVFNFLNSMKAVFKFGKHDKLLAVTTLSFDIAVLEIFLPLISGGTIFLASQSQAIDGNSLKEILNNSKITHMQATPTTWRLIYKSGWSGSEGLTILSGGEAFPIDLAQSLLPFTRNVFNMYGPTETTVWSTIKKLSLDDSYITVGSPIANTRCYILDENLQMCAIGATGELFIAGAGLALGYYRQPELTQERFVSDPFFPGQRMYATGDLARFCAGGDILCLGRLDDQVKVRGYRIELGEIENVINKIAGISEAVVVTNSDRPEDVKIIAYLKLIDIEKFDERKVRLEISKILPSYMMPSHFIIIDEIPKTLNGKIDKKSLPPLKQSAATNVAVCENDSALGKKLRELWKEVIGVDLIQNTDNFFALGGNSLNAVSLFSKISAELNLDIPLAVLIESGDFSSFVDVVSSRAKNSSLLFSSWQNSFRSLVAIKLDGNKKPLICFHGVGGNILNYVPLASLTKNKRPLLALQSLGLNGEHSPISSIEKMAESYIKEIKSAQPIGPYTLMGGSMGGMIAFEVARQLKQNGDLIEKLIMLDTFGPKLNLPKNDFTLELKIIKRLKGSIIFRVKYFLNRIQSFFYRKLGKKLPLSVLLVEVERHNYHAIWNYQPVTPFDGDLYLVRSKTRDSGWYSDPTLGWRNLISGEIKTFEIEGDHKNFLESPELFPILSDII